MAEAAGVTVPAANFQTLWQHEQGEVYPGPHYRRAYCLLYAMSEPELGFRNALPGEQTPMDFLPIRSGNGDRSKAVEDVLSRIAFNDVDANGRELRERILRAWSHRQAGGDLTGSPLLVIIGGYAGSGKSEFGRFLSQLTGWPVLDKDPVTRPLVEQLLIALGSDAHDRHTDLYWTKVRPLEYRCLLEAAYANLDCGISTVLTAPFIAELTDPGWMRRMANRFEARGVKVSVVWIDCDLETMREYIGFRSAARDSWKLQNWEDYAATVDIGLRPAVPHLVVDNRMGSAVSLTDQVQRMLGAVS
ncbi:AAA family ATPase [Actinorugispora endophytica]|uniref:AAA family ATPase n=1 Tax=Actinorugispora endophytica TaxID=1605990 RepID=UPI001FB6301E|nr:ATP-binding protein [Actinorugispora endophytica]